MNILSSAEHASLPTDHLLSACVRAAAQTVTKEKGPRKQFAKQTKTLRE